MKKHPERVSLNDAVKMLMKKTGRTRRQAEQAILQALKSGAIEATGEPVVYDSKTGEAETLSRRPIPKEVFADIPAEH